MTEEIKGKDGCVKVIEMSEFLSNPVLESTQLLEQQTASKDQPNGSGEGQN